MKIYELDYRAKGSDMQRTREFFTERKDAEAKFAKIADKIIAELGEPGFRNADEEEGCLNFGWPGIRDRWVHLTPRELNMGRN